MTGNVSSEIISASLSEHEAVKRWREQADKFVKISRQAAEAEEPCSHSALIRC